MNRSERGITASRDGASESADGLYRAIVVAAVAFAILALYLLLRRGETGPVLTPLPWFVPVIALFQSLALFSVAFLALGRHSVLRDPASFWIGMGAAGYGVALAFYALTWPDLLPGGGSIIASLPGTPAWFVQFGITIFGGLLLVAATARRPKDEDIGGRMLIVLSAAWIAFLILAFSLAVAAEEHLPSLVTSTGAFTIPLLAWNAVAAVLFAAGAILTTHRYLQTRDALLGYTAFAQMAFAFSVLATVGGMRRYDLWWYMLRVILAGSTLAVLFGLLMEYVHLYSRERERTAEVLRAEEEKLAFYRRTIAAATGGKLIVTDGHDIEKVAGPAVASWEIRVADDIRGIRGDIERIASDMGFDQSRCERLGIALGEAITNVLKHAGEGEASLHKTDDGVIAVVSDRGPGIPALALPDVALTRGYSTAETLGVGYKVMIEFTDRVYLATGADGTTVALEMKYRPPEVLPAFVSHEESGQ